MYLWPPEKRFYFVLYKEQKELNQIKLRQACLIPAEEEVPSSGFFIPPCEKEEETQFPSLSLKSEWDKGRQE